MVRSVVIEDSDRVREITCELLGRFGYEAVGAPDPATGVSYCYDHRPELILLDWDLPQLGALDVLTGLAEAGLTPKPTVILMAAENDPRQFALARAAGASFYVLKPFDADDFARALERAGFEISQAA
ncbi:MAG: response regulator [Pseudomonadota bacterium]